MKINKAILFAVAAGASMLPFSASAQGCPQAPKPEIEVQTPYLEVSMNSVPEPVAYAPFPKAMETSLGPGWTINGLTVVRPLVKTQITTADAKVDGKTCVWVTKAVVSFGFFEPANIYVSSRYKPGTCEFDAIRNHENQHVGIHLNTRAKHVPLMQARIEKAVTGAVKASDAASGIKAIQANMSEAVDDGIRSFQVETGQLNGLLDSTNSYLKLQSQCSNWW